jgi:hypothetical protein
MALTRSSRGNLVDFELLKIKSQLAAKPVPRAVEDRKQVIETASTKTAVVAEQPAVTKSPKRK